jgi:hypothetical protein
MSFSYDNEFEYLSDGTPNWGASFNANMAIAERGYSFKGLTGQTINSGDVLSVTSAGYLVRNDPRSSQLLPLAIAPYAISSGQLSPVLARGVVRSFAPWSGNIIGGQPVFVSTNSPGTIVGSYAGHGDAVGMALGADAILFAPGNYRVFPERVSIVSTLGPIVVGSQANFALLLGNRGIVREVRAVGSHDRFKLRFWSGSSRVASELLYETLTKSLSTASGDVGSTTLWDRALFPYNVSEANSPVHIYGRIDAQSATGVTSAYVVLTVIAERFL